MAAILYRKRAYIHCSNTEEEGGWRKKKKERERERERRGGGLPLVHVQKHQSVADMSWLASGWVMEKSTQTPLDMS